MCGESNRWGRHPRGREGSSRPGLSLSVRGAALRAAECPASAWGAAAAWGPAVSGLSCDNPRTRRARYGPHEEREGVAGRTTHCRVALCGRHLAVAVRLWEERGARPGLGPAARRLRRSRPLGPSAGETAGPPVAAADARACHTRLVLCHSLRRARHDPPARSVLGDGAAPAPSRSSGWADCHLLSDRPFSRRQGQTHRRAHMHTRSRTQGALTRSHAAPTLRVGRRPASSSLGSALRPRGVRGTMA